MNHDSTGAATTKERIRSLKSNSIVYLDNNQTALCPDSVGKAMLNWINVGSPSVNRKLSKTPRRLITEFRKKIANNCGFNLEGKGSYKIIFTSGAAEANQLMITSTTRSYAHKTGLLPHVITTEIEHDSILKCCERLLEENLIQLTILSVRTGGPEFATLDPKELLKKVRTNTCIISVIAASGETGALNDLKTIGTIAHSNQIPLHTDAAQLFGKSAFRPIFLNIDAFSVSFHKFGGPPGVGLLVIKNDLINGYDMGSLVGNTCLNQTSYGGTINIPGIAGSLTAYNHVLNSQKKDNISIKMLRTAIKQIIAKRILSMYICDYKKAQKGENKHLQEKINRAKHKNRPIVVWVCPSEETLLLPNTLLMSVICEDVSGWDIAKELESQNIIVGSPECCPRTTTALNLPEEIKNGFLRISLGAESTAGEIKKFASAFIKFLLVGEPLKSRRRR